MLSWAHAHDTVALYAAHSPLAAPIDFVDVTIRRHLEPNGPRCLHSRRFAMQHGRVDVCCINNVLTKAATKPAATIAGPSDLDLRAPAHRPATRSGRYELHPSNVMIELEIGHCVQKGALTPVTARSKGEKQIINVRVPWYLCVRPAHDTVIIQLLGGRLLVRHTIATNDDWVCISMKGIVCIPLSRLRSAMMVPAAACTRDIRTVEGKPSAFDSHRCAALMMTSHGPNKNNSRSPYINDPPRLSGMLSLRPDESHSYHSRACTDRPESHRRAISPGRHAAHDDGEDGLRLGPLSVSFIALRLAT